MKSAKLTTVLSKLKKNGIEVKKESVEPTDFYYFSIGDEDFEFTNQPIAGNRVDDICRTFINGSSPSFYSSIDQVLKKVAK